MSWGGGWGNPLDREPNAVLNDVLDGSLSRHKARIEYGVVLTKKADKVDIKSTRSLRQKLKKRERIKAQEQK